MKLSNSLSRRLGIEAPIFGFSHNIEVTAAICRAGGFGVYGATQDAPDVIRDKMRRLNQLCDGRPFGINLVLSEFDNAHDDPVQAAQSLPQGHKDFVQGLRDKYRVPAATQPSFFMNHMRSKELIDAQADAALDSGASLLAMAIGTQHAFVRRARGRGMLTLALVGSPRHVKKVEDMDVDILVAQGYDAGAHTGNIGTMSLVPQVVDAAGGRPVLAAGGIANGRQVAAALALGAQGVWTGTIWLGAVEHQTDPVVLNKLIKAGSEDTVISKSWSGKTNRMLRSAWSDAWQSNEAPEPLKMPYQQVLVAELVAAANEHRIEPLMWSSVGQSVAYIKSERPVAEIMQQLVTETEGALRHLRTFDQ